MSSQHLQITRNNDVLVVRFLDRELAGDLPDELGQELCSVADQEGCTKLLLNFSGVDFLANGMLGKVVQLNNTIKQKGGTLKLCEICPYVREVFVTTKLDTLIPVKGTEPEGVMACNSPARE